jgi:hypothetical protein
MNDVLTDDTELISAFERCLLTSQQWNHRAHVRVAFLYAFQHQFDQALERMRVGLRALNAAHQVPNLPDRGYNETITVAFLRLIYAACHNGQFSSSADFCDHNPDLLDKTALLRFYSRECLSSPQAKTTFVEPDLAPLPISARKLEDSVS